MHRQVVDPTTEPASDPSDRRPVARRQRALAGAALVALALGAAACGSDGKDASSTGTTEATTTSTAPSETPSTQGSGGGGGGGNGGGGGGGGTKPVIDSFVTPENIDCHNGNFQEFTASWTTTNATRVTISIDGAGVYKEYPGPSGEDSLPFNCSSSHTFLLTAYGSDGATTTKSVTLQPRNAQGSSTTTSSSMP